MRILITGGTGFIGHHLVKRLQDLNHDIIITGISGEYNIPFLSRNGWRDLGGKVDVCFHLAANNDTTCNDLSLMLKDNVEQPIMMFEKLLKKNDCENFVVASSCAVYGKKSEILSENMTLEPCNVYGKSKKIFEEFCLDFQNKAKVVCLRYSNVYGPEEDHKGKRASMVSQILNSVFNKKSPKLFKYGEQKRDWVYVSDVVDANILSINMPSGIYNCGNGTSRSFNEIIGVINSFIPDYKKIIPEYIDNPFLDKYQEFTQTDITKLSKFGYCPKFDLEKGIEELMKKAS